MSEEFMDIEFVTKTARALRFGMVYAFYRDGMLDKTDAMELLSGPLTPDDDTTFVDDSWLMNIDDPEDAPAKIYAAAA